MTKRIHKVLNDLEEVISSEKYNCHFEEPISMEVIENVEKCLEITLPASYKEFLMKYDGGFICDDTLEHIIKRENSIETAVWNNCYIFGFGEMMREYIDLSDSKWKVYDWEGIYPIIPFGRSHTHELLVFILPLNENNESPVYDAFHEDPMNDWGLISEDFTEFLEQYLEAKGQLNCIGSAAKDLGVLHVPTKSGWKMPLDDSGTPQDRLAKYTACLEFDPDDSWNLRKRGYAYMLLEDWETALIDLNKSIKLYPDQTYAYYLRGECYMKTGKFANALREFSIVVDREPNDIFYICARAEAYYQLGDFQRAIEETTHVIEIDENYDLAYMTRCSAYMAIGETEKAEEDAEKGYYK